MTYRLHLNSDHFQYFLKEFGSSGKTLDIVHFDEWFKEHYGLVLFIDVNKNKDQGLWFIDFETESEAVEFKLRHL